MIWICLQDMQNMTLYNHSLVSLGLSSFIFSPFSSRCHFPNAIFMIISEWIISEKHVFGSFAILSALKSNIKIPSTQHSPLKRILFLLYWMANFFIVTKKQGIHQECICNQFPWVCSLWLSKKINNTFI